MSRVNLVAEGWHFNEFEVDMEHCDSEDYPCSHFVEIWMHGGKKHRLVFGAWSIADLYKQTNQPVPEHFKRQLQQHRQRLQGQAKAEAETKVEGDGDVKVQQPQPQPDVKLSVDDVDLLLSGATRADIRALLRDVNRMLENVEKQLAQIRAFNAALERNQLAQTRVFHCCRCSSRKEEETKMDETASK